MEPLRFVLASQWERSTLRRLCSWKIIRKVLFGAACLATLIGLFYAEENWRGRRAWNSYQNELKAQGEPVTVADVAPPEISSERNFAAIPLMDLVFPRGGSAGLGDDWNDYERASMQMNRVRAFAGGGGNKPRWKPIDLVAWDYAFRNHKLGEKNENLSLPPITDALSQSNAAVAVVQWLEVYTPVLEQFRQASSRPESRYPIRYDTPNPMGILLPHLAVNKRLCQVLGLKAAAELARGDSSAALDDLLLALRISDSLKSEPALISYFVRLACFDITLQTIWDGLAPRRWSAEDLEALQRQLAQYDFLRDLRLPLQGERALVNGTFSYLRDDPGGLREILDQGDSLAFVFGFAPRGWLYFEQVNYNRMFERYVQIELSRTNPRLQSAEIDQTYDQRDDAFTKSGIAILFQHQLLVRSFLPSLSKAYLRAGVEQASAEMGTVACALERYRQVTGAYPENLSALAPRFLASIPIDVVTTEPYQYRLNPDGTFLLHSIGWDQTDDGGQTGDTSETGDWVWTY